MADFTQTLVAAQLADKEAEQRLNAYAASDYPGLAQALAAEIANDTKPIEARQIASVYLKNTLNAKSAAQQRELHDRWKNVDPAVRKAIKDHLLSTLHSVNTDVPRFAAIPISEIACVELPFGEWPDFVHTMTQSIASGSEGVSLACLTCLGNVCERIEEVNVMLEVPDLSEETVNQMLSAVVKGVEPKRSDTQRLAALTALNKSLGFVHNNMDVKQERDFIMSAFCGATQAQDAKVRRLAYLCLDTVAELYYDKLPDYMKQIYELTIAAAKTDPEEDVKISALEFWHTVAKNEFVMLFDEEKCRSLGRAYDGPRCEKYVEAATSALLPVFLETLSQHKDDTDEDDYDLRQAGSICLGAFNEAAFDVVIPIVIPFVQANITQSDWRKKDAAIVAFFSILIGPPTSQLASYIRDIIPVLLQTFGDPHEIVRDSAVFCISTMVEAHMPAVSIDQANMIIQALLTKLDEAPKVAATACTALFHLCSAIKEYTEQDAPTNILSQFMQPLMTKFLACMDRNDADERNLRTVAMTAASELIGAASSDVQPVLQQLLPAVIGRIGQALQMECRDAEEHKKREDILAFLIGLVTSLYLKLGAVDVQGQTDQVMELIIRVLQMQNANCHEEALFAIGAIAGVVEEKFNPYLPTLMPHVIIALQQIEQESLCKAGISVVSDICAAVSMSIQPFCDEVMKAFTRCLQDVKANRELKPAVFSCYGDIAMAIGGAYQVYLEHSCVFLMQASILQPVEGEDDLNDFINRLRLSILEAYTGIIVGLSDSNSANLFSSQVDHVLRFLEYLSRPESLRDESCLEKAVELLGEIISSIGPSNQPQMKTKLQHPFVAQLLQAAYATNSQSTAEVVNWCGQLVNQATA